MTTADDFLGRQITELTDTELMAALQVFRQGADSPGIRGIWHALAVLCADERDRRRRDIARLEAMRTGCIDDGESGELLSE